MPTTLALVFLSLIFPADRLLAGEADSPEIYVNQYFEIRAHAAPTKYVFHGDTRVARVTGSLSANFRVQRLRAFAGWNLCSLAVTVTNALSQLSSPGSQLQALYKWIPQSSSYSTVADGETLSAGTVLWLKSRTNSNLTVIGQYSEPVDLSLTTGGAYVPSAGLEAWNITNALPPAASAWTFRPPQTDWSTRFEEPLQNSSDWDGFVPPGEAIFIRTSAPLQLSVPDPGLRFLFYHQDHLGSSACVSDAQSRLVRETDYYPFGGERRVYAASPEHSYYSFAQKERDTDNGLLNFESRHLSPLLARFIRVDSLNEQFKQNRLHLPQFLNAYAYCQNNPLALVDPDGREARVTLHGDNKITIRVAIQYVGPLATKENIARANKGIEKYWSGKYGRYNVKMEVVNGSSDPSLKPAVVTLTAKDDEGKYLRSHVKIEADTGNWNPKDSDFSWVAAHETGHLMGLDDRYKDNKWGGSTPDKGWRGNMMGERGAPTQEKNITELHQRADQVLASEGRAIHRQVVDRSPAALRANQEALERDMLNQVKAWQMNP